MPQAVNAAVPDKGVRRGDSPRFAGTHRLFRASGPGNHAMSLTPGLTPAAPHFPFACSRLPGARHRVQFSCLGPSAAETNWIKPVAMEPEGAVGFSGERSAASAVCV